MLEDQKYCPKGKSANINNTSVFFTKHEFNIIYEKKIYEENGKKYKSMTKTKECIKCGFKYILSIKHIFNLNI